MSKIVQAVNAMILNKSSISNVISNESELFFLYRDKYIWSISPERDGAEYILWYYPGAENINSIAGTDGEDWNYVPMVVYRTSGIGTKEALASFAELHSIVKDRVYGMDGILDDIISDNNEF